MDTANVDLIELPGIRASLLRRIWHSYSVLHDDGRTEYGTQIVRVTFRRWHPGYWWLRLHPPIGIECALGEACTCEAT